MLALLRALSSPLISLLFMMTASGLFNTFVSLRLEMEGASPEEIGVVTSALYAGVLLGSFWIDRWIYKMGHIRSFTALALTLAILVLAQGFWIHSWYWSFLRLFAGMCMAGIFIVIESWFLLQSGPQMRGAALSIYLAAFYAALSGGQLLINVTDPTGISPFCVTAGFLALSVLPIFLSKTPAPPQQELIKLSVVQLFRISPLGFIGSVVSGVVLASVYSLAPIYAKTMGLSLSQIGTFMAVLIFGGFSLQWPAGRWADRTSRRKVLNIASVGTVLLSILIPFIPASEPLWLYFSIWLFGGFSFTIYPLSMAHACENVQESQIVAVTGGFVLSYGIGAIVGPLAAPVAMQFLGDAGFFYFLAFVCSFLALLGLKRRTSAIIDK